MIIRSDGEVPLSKVPETELSAELREILKSLSIALSREQPHASLRLHLRHPLGHLLTILWTGAGWEHMDEKAAGGEPAAH